MLEAEPALPSIEEFHAAWNDPQRCTELAALAYYGLVQGIANRYLRDMNVPDQAIAGEDIAQDTFYAFQHAQPGLKPEGFPKIDNIRNYLARSAISFCLKRSNRRDVVEMVPLFDTSQGFETPDIADPVAISTDVEAILRKMRPKDALILQLHSMHDFTFEEIGNIIDMSAEAVRKRYDRAAKKYRALTSTEPERGS